MTSTLLRIVRAPWSGWHREDIAFLSAGLPLAAATLTVMALPWMFVIPVALTAVLATIVVSFVLPLVVVRPLTALQRRRFDALLGMDIPQVPRQEQGLRRFVPSETTVRQLGYHTVVSPLLATVTLLVFVAQLAGLALATFYVWVWVLSPPIRVANPGYTTMGAYLTVAGLVLLVLLRRLPEILCRVDTELAVALLGPSKALQLEQRVEDLTERRAGVVDAADAERRRIERDLHDGAQQRLVSLAMNLGLARETMPDLSADARLAIGEAHEEAKEALAELRESGPRPAPGRPRRPRPGRGAVRDRRARTAAGAAPGRCRAACLADGRGGRVLRRLRGAGQHQPSTRSASQVEVIVERRENVLRVVVADDGVGGADPPAGGGLAGLAQRAASVDGTLRIDSPVGGPTVITVELPCEQ